MSKVTMSVVSVVKQRQDRTRCIIIFKDTRARNTTPVHPQSAVRRSSIRNMLLMSTLR